jgi:mono/diheme cytochrome c family protein
MSHNCRSTLIAGSVVIVWGLAAAVGAQSQATQKPTIKTTVAVPIVSVEGADNYKAYCAVCHGEAAKGNGPAAPAMKVPVPDLTMIAKRHGGKFNATDVEYIVRGTGKTQTPAHGREDMPIWGEVFRSEDRGKNALRISNLVKYIETLQVK